IKGQKGEGIFVLTVDEIKDKMFDEQEIELLKPFFKNSDISRYKSSAKTDKSIIYIDRNLKKMDDRYPNIEKHLSRYYPILSQRRETINGSIEYFHLHWGRDEGIFKGEKIVAPQRSKLNTFAYNDIPWYSSADVYYITSKNKNVELKYLLGILNSKLYYIWLYHKGKRKGEMLELYHTPLKEMPVILSENKMNIMIGLVDAMLNETEENKIRLLQSDIDKLVYRIYELDDFEIQWIEGLKIVYWNRV
ncbi:MAG TPA: TaqI-like C-terminal specificity domain-containing protein, partial [Clostridia bacterium]|nr:TaqI-like C-terminal specificity domain-containing protein [Clostridia bacterium]